MKSFLKRFSAFDLVVLAMMAALGVAVKPLVVSLAHMITGPLLIPGGSLAGGFYMMWLILGAAIVNKRGAATLIGLVQAILVLVAGVYGTHGIVSVLTYTLPGVAVDLFYFLARQKAGNKTAMFAGGIIANVVGVLLTNLVFFRLPLLPFLLSLSAGALSGGLGGLLAFLLFSRLQRLKV